MLILMRRLFKRKGQALNEYAILIGVIVAALIFMQGFMRKRLEGRLGDILESFRENRLVENFQLQNNKESTYSKYEGTNSTTNTQYGGRFEQGLMDWLTTGGSYEQIQSTKTTIGGDNKQTLANSAYKNYEEPQPD